MAYATGTGRGPWTFRTRPSTGTGAVRGSIVVRDPLHGLADLRVRVVRESAQQLGDPGGGPVGDRPHQVLPHTGVGVRGKSAHLGERTPPAHPEPVQRFPEDDRVTGVSGRRDPGRQDRDRRRRAVQRMRSRSGRCRDPYSPRTRQPEQVQGRVPCAPGR